MVHFSFCCYAVVLTFMTPNIFGCQIGKRCLFLVHQDFENQFFFHNIFAKLRFWADLNYLDRLN